jgi:1-deoxy-D-xylulose-5-phosphate synthase
MGLLESVNSPADIKKLSIEQLAELAKELREKIIHTVSINGGHLASNLGVVEMTLALYYSFDFPNDRLLFDVGHQCYVHKIITGRREQFETIRMEDGLSGFPDINESPYDLFSVGHAGTAIPTAVGIAHGDQLAGRNNRVIALVGDGSIVNGVSFEGLNNAGVLRRQFLIILNDNSMAIDVTQGAFAKYLNRIRFTRTYEDFKRRAQFIADHLPFSKSMRDGLQHIKQGLKTALTPHQIFEQLGITYLGPIDGHDLGMMTKAFDIVRDAPYPILLHIQTQKGFGSSFATSDPCKFHSPSGYELTGEEAIIKPGKKSYTTAFGEALLELAEKDKKIVAFTAAMPDGTGLVDFKMKFPDRYFDVGISESAAVDIAAGMAKTGFKPVVAIYSTFLQRSFDQIWQEIILQKLPCVFCIDRAGLVGSDGAVHHGFCDIAFLRALPNMVCCAPADELELKEALKFALTCELPVAIRYPRDIVPVSTEPSVPFAMGKSRTIREGNDAAILAYGAIACEAIEAADNLSKDGINVSVISARFAKPLDEPFLTKQLLSDKPMIIVEDHSRIGGFGSAVFEFAQQKGLSLANVKHLAIPEDDLIPHASRQKQLALAGLDAAAISKTVRTILNTNSKSVSEHSPQKQVVLNPLPLIK